MSRNSGIVKNLVIKIKRDWKIMICVVLMSWFIRDDCIRVGIACRESFLVLQCFMLEDKHSFKFGVVISVHFTHLFGYFRAWFDMFSSSFLLDLICLLFCTGFMSFSWFYWTLSWKEEKPSLGCKTEEIRNDLNWRNDQPSLVRDFKEDL